MNSAKSKDGKHSTEWKAVVAIAITYIGAMAAEMINSGAVDKTSVFGIVLGVIVSIYTVMRGLFKMKNLEIENGNSGSKEAASIRVNPRKPK
jgi:hypothetical protein